jgi:tetratricopeptide (TPR) repeat protein
MSPSCYTALELVRTMHEIAAQIDSISEAVRAGTCGVFCGAGISYNSGLPLARPFLETTLRHCRSRYQPVPPNWDSLWDTVSVLPFEFFLETLEAAFDVVPLLEVFRKGSPNTNHYFLAHLLKQKKIAFLVTTNFDDLIERAIRVIDPESPTRVAYAEQQYGNMLPQCEPRTLLKIHGCINHKDSIRATIKSLTKAKTINLRRTPLEYLFRTGEHRAVIIMGYSLSDVFDITPAIASIKVEKTVYLIRHGQSRRVTPISEVAPFKECRGYVLDMDTDEFVKEMWTRSLDRTKTPYQSLVYEQRWGSVLTAALNDHAPTAHHACFAIGLLLERSGDLSGSMAAYDAALKAAGPSTNDHFVILLAKGAALRRHGELEQALKCYQNAMVHSGLRPGLNRIMLVNNLGNLFKDLGRFDLAEKALLAAAADFRENKLSDHLADTYTSLGNLYRHMGRFAESRQHHSWARD